MGTVRSATRALGRLEASEPAGAVDGRRLHRVGTAEDFPLGAFRIFDVAGREIGVVRTERGFFALGNTCPHQGAPICLGKVGGTMLPSEPGEYDFGLAGRIVRCPWHTWEFDVETGHNVGGTTSKRATTYPVQVTDEGVYVVAGSAARA